VAKARESRLSELAVRLATVRRLATMNAMSRDSGKFGREKRSAPDPIHFYRNVCTSVGQDLLSKIAASREIGAAVILPVDFHDSTDQSLEPLFLPA
jgi:hypothetical protein